MPWGEVSQNTDIHPEESGLLPEDTGKPWKVFEHCYSRIKTKPKLILTKVEEKCGERQGDQGRDHCDSPDEVVRA